MDYTYPSVYFAYGFFFLMFFLAVYFFVITWRDGYWSKDGEEIKNQVFFESYQGLQAAGPVQIPYTGHSEAYTPLTDHSAAYTTPTDQGEAIQNRHPPGCGSQAPIRVRQPAYTEPPPDRVRQPDPDQGAAVSIYRTATRQGAAGSRSQRRQS